MTALQGAVLALATAAGTAAVARFGARQAGVGAYLAASLVALGSLATAQTPQGALVEFRRIVPGDLHDARRDADAFWQ